MKQPKYISSKDNPAYKALKKLADDARQQRQQGLTLLDGIHLVAAYRDIVGAPEQMLVSEHGCEQAEIQAILESLPATETLLLRNSLFRELSGVATPTGILAVIRIPRPGNESTIRGSCIMLDAVQDAGNVGSILRTAAAAGIRDVLLGPGCASAWTPRLLRAAQGAHFDLGIREQVNLAEAMQAYSGITVAATAHQAQSLYQVDLRGDIAWLFGNEGSGITPSLETAAKYRVRIPLQPACESLNIAAAAAICLFEAVRQRMG